jgi:hypothetical protein
MLPPASGGRRKLGQRWNQSYAKQEGGELRFGERDVKKTDIRLAETIQVLSKKC